jgi:hypothetical protein
MRGGTRPMSSVSTSGDMSVPVVVVFVVFVVVGWRDGSMDGLMLDRIGSSRSKRQSLIGRLDRSIGSEPMRLLPCMWDDRSRSIDRSIACMAALLTHRRQSAASWYVVVRSRSRSLKNNAKCPPAAAAAAAPPYQTTAHPSACLLKGNEWPS